jgi:hypothetical protein
MSDEEIAAMEKRAQQDSRMLQITDQQARQWQDFNVQLDYSSQSIRNTFVRGLGPLTPQLSKLSDALSGAIDTVLKSPNWVSGLMLWQEVLRNLAIILLRPILPVT